MQWRCSGRGIRKSRIEPARVGEKLIVVFIGERLDGDNWIEVKGFASPSDPYTPVDIMADNRLQMTRNGMAVEGIYHDGNIMTDDRLIDVQVLEVRTEIEVLEHVPAAVHSMAAHERTGEELQD